MNPQPTFTKALAILLLALSFVRCAECQTIILPQQGTGDTTMSYAEVYDNGGPNGPYSTSCNATYTFHTISPNGRYRIEVESYLTHPQGNAHLIIRNNSTSGGVVCSAPPSGDGTYESSGNTVVIHFRADDDYPTQGFKVILCEFEQVKPTNFQTEYLDSNTLKLTWEEPDNNVVWVLDYAVVDQHTDTYNYFNYPANPRTTVQLTEPEYTINNIPVGYRVVYRLLSLGATGCYTPMQGVAPPYEPQVECPCLKPLNPAVEDLGGTVRITWDSDPSASLWHVFSYDNTVDTFLDGSITELVIPWDYPCTGGILFINGNCRDSTCNNVYVELPRGGCHRSVSSISRLHTDGHSIDISWHATNNALDKYLLFIRRYDEPPDSNHIVDTFSHSVTSCTIEGLRPHTLYFLRMLVLCEGTSPACSDVSATISTTIDGCIDFINFYDPSIHMTNGTYANPLQNSTIGDERHIVILDSSLRDPLTGNRLRMVPPGEEVSFRLGDENVGAMGETVTFDYLVDTLDKDMLLVKYAVVLQNPNHNSSNQPHFTLEILDQFGNIVDTQCCYADFFAAGGLAGWNSVSGTNVIWKDWTNVGIDISAYHGQQLHVRFTTKDCADGGHFGYAYFTIACDNRRIALVNLCDSDDSVRLRAPEGFDYEWTRGNDATVISTDNEIMVPIDSAEYVCHCTFLGKAVCGFTVHATALLPKPLADIACRIDTCAQKVYLYNRCRVDIDSSFLHLVRQQIVDVVWTIDGQTIAGQHLQALGGEDTLVLPIEANGDHTVSIRCRLSDSQCADTAEISYHIDCYHRQAIEGRGDICFGDSVTVSASLNPADQFQYIWGDGSTSPSRSFLPLNDTSITLITTFLHCTDTLVHHIFVHPNFDDTTALVLCQGDYDTLGFIIHRDTPQGLHTNSGVSRYGCDSLFTIDLALNPSYYDTTQVSTCDEAYSDSEFNVDQTGIYTHSYQTVQGCDSLFVLDFVRHELSVDTFEAEIVYGDTYSDNGFLVRREGWHEQVLKDRNGCDSTVRLNLHIVALRFPNAVTPNGDGVNDRWGVVGILDAKEFEYSVVWIYDRWGRLICKRENIHSEEQFWDPNDKHIPTGTYFFRFYARHSTGREIEHNGAIEVIRE